MSYSHSSDCFEYYSYAVPICSWGVTLLIAVWILTKVFPDNYLLNIIKYEGGASKMLIGLLVNFGFFAFLELLDESIWCSGSSTAETPDEMAEASEQGVLRCHGGDGGGFVLKALPKYCSGGTFGESLCPTVYKRSNNSIVCFLCFFRW